MGFRLGVDVGGTFTDLLLFDQQSGNFWRHKTPSTPHDSSEGILNGVQAICASAGVSPGDIEFFLHGTTVATNAVLEGKGARVGLVTTEGYRQIMQIARSYVPGGLAGWIVWPKPEPLARLEDTVEIKGRIDARGREVRPIDDADIRAALIRLRDQGIEALTVSLINSYLNGDHELRVGELAAEIMPDIPVSLSHQVLPEMQEYERTLTTVANAAVRPIVGRYVRNLRSRLEEVGMRGRLSLLRSDGGLMSSHKSEEQPVSLLMSGPAGGVTGALWVARYIWGDEAGFVAGAAALVGHCLPVWLKFKGGKGVATFFGIMLVGLPYVGVFCALTWLVMAFVFRISSLAALTATALAPLFAYVFHANIWGIGFAAALAVFIWYRHRANIQALLRGEERKIGAPAEPARPA